MLKVMRLKLVTKGYRTLVCCLESTYQGQASSFYWYFKGVDRSDTMLMNIYTGNQVFQKKGIVLGVHREFIHTLPKVT